MKGKKLIALALCLLLTISLLPVSALAEGDGEEPAQPVDTKDTEGISPAAESETNETPADDGNDDGETNPPVDTEDGETPAGNDDVEDIEGISPAGNQDDVLLQTSESAGTDGENESGESPEDNETEILGGTRDADVYVVAGSANADLNAGGVETPIFGTAWDGTLATNQMILSGSVYTKTYTVAEEHTVAFKVVKNGGTENALWYGDSNGNNIQMTLPAGCKFTVTFDPSTTAVSTSVTMDYTSVYVASDLLNNWQPDGQLMTQKQPGIWEARLDVPAGNYNYKFTIDGSWDRNFGRGPYQGTFVTGTMREATWNGSNDMMLKFDAATTVILRLDLTNFNYQTKSGARYGVFVQDNSFNITLNATLDGVQGTPFYEGGGYTVADNTGVLLLLNPVDQYYRPKASQEGTLVRFTVTVPNGYSCTVTVTDENNNIITPTAGETTTDNLGRAVTEYSFTLPAADVNILAAFSGEAAPLLHTITLRPSLYAPGASIPHTMTEEEKTAAIQTLTIVPPQAYAGETVTMTVIPNPGYFIKNDNYGTYTKVAEYTYEYVVQESNSVEIILSIALAHGLDEGCYLQIDGADQADWIFMIHDNPFVDYADLVYYTKQTLSAGQELAVQYVSTPGGNPQLMKTYTVQASDLADGKATVYFHRVGEPLITLSCLNGYYISWQDQNPAHWDDNTGWTRSNSAYPFETYDTHLFTACGEGDAYVKEEELASGKPVKVAHFVDGTVDQVWNRWDGVIATVPYDGFTSDYDPGVVFFRPSVGIVSILRTYDLANGSQDVSLGAPAYCLDASNNAQVRFTVTPIGPNDSIEAVTVTTASGTVISAVKNSDFVPPTDSPNTEEYVIALPTEDAVVTVAVSQYRAIICNANVYFEGQIRLSFGFDGDTLPEGGTVRISKAGHNNNDTVQDVAVADGVLVEGVMEYYLPVMIPEFADQVTVQVLDAEENLLPIRSRSGVEYGTEGFTYSVKQYAERKKVNGSTKEVRELAQALLDYGTAAQIYFEYGEYAGLSVSELVTAITAQTLIDGGFAAVVTPAEERPEGVSAGINVYFESDNTLRVTYSGMAAGTTYTYTLDGVVKKPKAGYLQVRNIAAPNLDVPHTFTISDGTKTFSVQASAISYALTCIRNGTEARQNLGKAFYLYNQAANAFFGDN